MTREERESARTLIGFAAKARTFLKLNDYVLAEVYIDSMIHKLGILTGCQEAQKMEASYVRQL